MREEDLQTNVRAIMQSPNYRLAELDTAFLQQNEARSIRLLLEHAKPEMELRRQNIQSTICVFGGTQVVDRPEAERRLEAARALAERLPDDPTARQVLRRAERIMAKVPYYEAAREFARLVSAHCQQDHPYDYVIVTGGGPGIMEAANRGAYDVGAKSIGLNITLQREQLPNPYVTPGLCFQFHYFALRKMHFLLRAKALVVFPGGFGTLDELFDALTLRQTNRMQSIPIILYGRGYWEKVLNVPFLIDEGVVMPEDAELLTYAESPQEAWELIHRYPHREGAPVEGALF